MGDQLPSTPLNDISGTTCRYQCVSDTSLNHRGYFDLQNTNCWKLKFPVLKILQKKSLSHCTGFMWVRGFA